MLEENLAHVIRSLDFMLACVPSTLVEARLCRKEDADEVYERVVSSALATTGRLIATLYTVSKEGGASSTSATTTTTKDDMLTKLLNERVWPCLSDDGNQVIRREACSQVVSLCTTESGVSFVRSSSAALAPLLFKAIDESCVNGLYAEVRWECLLHFLRVCPDGWGLVNCNKLILPKLFKVLRSGRAPSKTLFPLVATLHSETTGKYKDGSARFYRDFFESLVAGVQRSKADLSQHAALLAAQVECALFVLLCPRVREDDEAMSSACASTVAAYFVQAFRTFLEHDAELAPSSSSWVSKVQSTLLTALAKLGKIDADPRDDAAVAPAASGGSSATACLANLCKDPLPDEIWRTFKDALFHQGVATTSTSNSAALAYSRLVPLLSTAVTSSEEATTFRWRIFELFRSAHAHGLGLVAVLDADTEETHVLQVLRFLTDMAPHLKRVEAGLLRSEYDGGETSLAFKCIHGFVEGTKSSAVFDLALELVLMATDEALETSAEVGLVLWRKVIKLLASTGNRKDFLRALQLSTPDPSKVWQHQQKVLSDDVIDTIALGIFSAEPQDSALLDRIFGHHHHNEANEVPWPIVSQKTLTSLVEQCVERGASDVTLRALSLLLQGFVKQKRASSSETAMIEFPPHLAEAMKPYAAKLLVLLFQCRMVVGSPGDSGVDLWEACAPRLCADIGMEENASLLLEGLSQSLRMELT